MRILFASDSPESSRAWSRALRGRGVQVDTAPLAPLGAGDVELYDAAIIDWDEEPSRGSYDKLSDLIMGCVDARVLGVVILSSFELLDLPIDVLAKPAATDDVIAALERTKIS